MKSTVAMMLAISVGLAGAALAIPSGGDAASSNLTAKLALDSSHVTAAVAGQASTIHATYTITNSTQQPIKIEVSGRPVIWNVVDSSGTVVCDPDRGRPIPQFIALRILQPGEHQEFSKTILLVSSSGDPLPAGTYTLHARWSRGASGLETSRSFTIQ